MTGRSPGQPLAEPAALSIAERLLGRRPDHLAACHPAAGGDDSHAFRLRVGRDALLLQVKRRPGSPVGVYFHGCVRAAGIPVPELVAFDAGAGPNGETCAVWEWVEGVPAEWAPGEPCPYDEAELGALLRRIHDLRFDGPFGCLGDDPSQRTYTWSPDLEPVSESWAGYFRCDQAARRYFDRGYLNRAEAESLISLPERLRAEMDRTEPRLLHMGDVMHNGNLVVDPRSGRIRAVLDYAESTAGDPRWELAWFQYYFADYPFERATFDLARFQAGYGSAPDPRDALGRFYLAAVLLFEKLVFYEPASARGRWAIATVKEVLRGLG